MTTKENLKKKAAAAEKRPAKYGEDIDLETYEFSESEMTSLKLDDLSNGDRSLISQVGFNPDGEGVAGTFAQFDNESILADVMIRPEGLEVLTTHEALSRYEWLTDYLWHAVPVDADKYTATSELQQYNGYFIRAKPGAKIEIPVQSCLVIKKGHSVQNVHNIVIAEEGSELHVITGCATPGVVERSLHLGISEFYVKNNAKLTFTMIHKWNEQMDVRPRSAAIVDENGTYISSYAILSTARTVQTYPKVSLFGRRSHADLYSVIYGMTDSRYDIGGSLTLDAPGASGKIVSRTVATDRSDIVARGELVGRVGGVKARLECNGLLLSDRARIGAVPSLEALAEGVELSHEATVGKVGADQLNYLMSRGLTEDEATSLIVSGFIRLKTPGLPPMLQRSIDDAVKLTLGKGL
jgi:Fe-S cluster assembly scaffold protein SufB